MKKEKVELKEVAWKKESSKKREVRVSRLLQFSACHG
jgi:hypothetical protein